MLSEHITEVGLRIHDAGESFSTTDSTPRPQLFPTENLAHGVTHLVCASICTLNAEGLPIGSERELLLTGLEGGLDLGLPDAKRFTLDAGDDQWQCLHEITHLLPPFGHHAAHITPCE